MIYNKCYIQKEKLKRDIKIVVPRTNWSTVTVRSRPNYPYTQKLFEFEAWTKQKLTKTFSFFYLTYNQKHEEARIKILDYFVMKEKGLHSPCHTVVQKWFSGVLFFYLFSFSCNVLCSSRRLGGFMILERTEIFTQLCYLQSFTSTNLQTGMRNKKGKQIYPNNSTMSNQNA